MAGLGGGKISGGNMTRSLTRLLDRYYSGKDAAHIEAEQTLRQTDRATLEEAKTRRSAYRDDPVIPLMNQALSGWHSDASKSFEGSLAHMDSVEARAHATQRHVPRADGLADDIAALYGSEPVPLLATRLMTQSNWPAWKISAVLLYLGERRETAALPALIRFQREHHSPYHAELVNKVLEGFRPDSVAGARSAENAFVSRHTEVPAEETHPVVYEDYEDEENDE
jgi:hypothetical protein